MLWIVFAAGWLPALIGAFAIAGRAPAGVLSAAGAAGAWAGLALAATLLILTAGYLRAIARPPAPPVLIAALAGSLAAALAMPLVFSADIYAYAYYGDLALHGANPYGHAAPQRADGLTAAAVRAWGGRIPPRCVYGPVAVALAAAADAAGSSGGSAAQVFAQRLAAAGAYGVFTAVLLRLVADPRARAAFLLHPSVIWSVAEGHNDAAMLAFAAAGLGFGRARAAAFTLAALVKAPAIALFGRIAGRRTRAAAVVLTLAGYLPLALAVGADRAVVGPGPAAAWQSPLGLLAASLGRLPTVTLALAALGACALAVRRLDAAERTPAFAFAAWFVLPNAYPWYSLWIVPLAARNVSSLWSRALLVAAGFAPARAVLDAMYPAADRAGASARVFHLPMIALEYLPPLLFLTCAALRPRRAAGTAAAIVVALLIASGAVPAGAQSAGPSPVPASAPATMAPAGAAPPGSPSPTAPAPNAAITPTPVPSAVPPLPSGSPTPALASPAPVSPGPVVPAPAPPVPAPPSGSSAPATGSGAPPAVAPSPVSTVNPFGYIITPPATPVAPDGPHILEVELNDRHIRAGGPLIVRVITSANVVGVEARALGRFIPIPQSSPGLFALAYTMPDGIPFWLLNRNYNIVIAAATADGRQTSVSFPMLLTR